MMWVKETFPPRPRARWLLMTTRLSINNFTGTERTLVAVGTLRLASMLVTTRPAAPRRISGCTASESVVDAVGAGAAGAVFGAGLAGAAGVGWGVGASCVAAG